MTESTTPATELTSQYLAQVVGDLDRNTKEQERIRAEISALQEQLLALQHDHTVLLSMQRALGAEAPTLPTQPAAPEDAAAPTSPSTPKRKRAKTTTESGTGKQAGPKKATTAQGGKTAAKKAAAKKPKTEPKAKAEASKSAQPTLVELIRRHLGEQSEPRSAAEVATALGKAHPERGIKTTVVRTTLEGLVARSQAHRTKQGTSVFYTAPDSPEPAAPAAAETQSAGD
ncbi:hypothetical protein [Streptomyces ureilyticus]|uniref:Regulatory protein n=1 Tax=Streptomyces ureilyticus TaxID=1775131 RepID=A0ABX0E0T8_9ACTN|nr:hypothetical protein [Streptomyces ureilyticus]NGO46148.1 hypothetical protein [Streptomyces ureilyticus]